MLGTWPPNSNTTITIMAAANGNGPLEPLRMPYVPLQCIILTEDDPPSKQICFLWGLKGLCPSKRSDVVVVHHRWNKGAFWGAYTVSTPPRSTFACSGGCPQSIRCVGARDWLVSGTLGANFHQRRSWSGWLFCVGAARGQCWPEPWHITYRWSLESSCTK